MALHAAVLEASAKFVLPDGFKPSYGTAGFRAQAHLLNSTVFRCGLLMAIRALKAGQVTGICVTASHNPAPDNGVKLVDPSGEMLAQAYEPDADELANAPSDEALAALVAALLEREGVAPAGGAGAAVLIAHDTRPTGPELAAAAAAGAACLGVEARVLGLLTTPQLHWAVMRTNQGRPAGEDAYGATLASAFAALVGPPPSPPHTLYVDCANGVGGPKMAALAPLLAPAGLALALRNTGGGVLNGGCGSDFLQGARRAPAGMDDAPAGSRCCAVDGDADRLMYFSPAGGAGAPVRLLLDGDKIAALAAALVRDLVAQLPDDVAAGVSVGVVQTAYANGASTAYLRGALGAEVAVTPTGVKHLHAAAHAFDAGIYFEANGHGTVLFRASLLERLRAVAAGGGAGAGAGAAAARELLALDGVINAAVGDAVSGILLVEAALRRKGWGLDEWAALYDDLPSIQRKVREGRRGAAAGGCSCSTAAVPRSCCCCCIHTLLLRPLLCCCCAGQGGRPLRDRHHPRRDARGGARGAAGGDRRRGGADARGCAGRRAALPPRRTHRESTHAGALRATAALVLCLLAAGRSFVRPSGTEDVVRVYAEAATQEAADALAAAVVALVHARCGGVGPAP
jgi:phosphoacetylglucosamine mutase